MSVKYADFLKFRSARRGRRRPSSEYRGRGGYRERAAKAQRYQEFIQITATGIRRSSELKLRILRHQSAFPQGEGT